MSVILQGTPYENLNDILCRKRKFYPKIHMESHGIPNRKINLEKEQSQRAHTYRFQMYYKAIVIKTECDLVCFRLL